MSQTFRESIDRKKVVETIIASNDQAKMRDALVVLREHADALEDLLVQCRIRCERAEKRLGEELRRKGKS